ncbi:hypothetical protein Afil01_05700 [Actinorhabdospora filicis]|uniref:HTH tetR-type domain-containing protein n=1 Tax=Actinorhabdospora filicis TaxID=1785913 RepID=A0A9W6SGV8_9ACTN|nr:TetR/AcrR family transcriptional regulator [Actinorhabdospora filicis]GLZ75763.1 hypothetical protein Afil01_05700 [Actinorhabdospora filicis]
MTDTPTRAAEAAAEILRADGSEAVTMRRIGAHIGLSAMAVYRHYPSREALLARVADEWFARLAAEWAPILTAPDPIAAGVEEMISLALREPKVYAFLFLEARDGARAVGELREGRSPTFNLVTGAVAAAMRAGLLREDDPWLVGLAITSHLHGLIGLHLGGRIGLPDGEFRELCRASLERLIHGIGA